MSDQFSRAAADPVRRQSRSAIFVAAGARWEMQQQGWVLGALLVSATRAQHHWITASNTLIAAEIAWTTSVLCQSMLLRDLHVIMYVIKLPQPQNISRPGFTESRSALIAGFGNTEALFQHYRKEKTRAKGQF